MKYTKCVRREIFFDIKLFYFQTSESRMLKLILRVLDFIEIDNSLLYAQTYSYTFDNFYLLSINWSLIPIVVILSYGVWFLKAIPKLDKLLSVKIISVNFLRFS